MDSTDLAEDMPGRRSANPGAPIVGTETRHRFVYRDREVTIGNMFVALGSALAVVGLVDIGLVWFPMQLGTAGWEFATVSRTFTNAPMTIMGLVLVVYGLIRRRTGPAVLRRMAIGLAALSFVLVAMAMLYGLAAPAVLSLVTDEGDARGLKTAMLKNGVEMIVYPTLLLAVAATVWRGITETKG